MRQVLILSNGTGEDRIGAALARTWRLYFPQDYLEALVLVGTGRFYQEMGIPVRAVQFEPPSAGFAYLNPVLLWRDFQAGLGGHLWRSWRSLKSQPADLILAVGDIVVALYARFSGAPFAFIGCALSDYYLAGRRSTYDPLQRWALKQATLGIYPRDPLTVANLQKLGLPALWRGNPMLDDLEPVDGWFYTATADRTPLALLPGSHRDAPDNFRAWLEALREASEEAWDLLCPLAPGLDRGIFTDILQSQGWQNAGPWTRGNNQLWFYRASDWGSILQTVRLVLGMAGTAHEQAVGLGVPVLAFPGRGLQYTWSFAEAQSRLLGPALTLLREGDPTLVTWQIRRMLRNPQYTRMARRISAERYGPRGAAERIVGEIARRIPD